LARQIQGRCAADHWNQYSEQPEGMRQELLQAHIDHPVSRREITQRYCRGKSVLDIGCVNHNLENVDVPDWQHAAIVEVAANVLGVDYLQEEVQELANRGFRVVAADISKPIRISERFDVIVIGHLIEHLSGLDGLMSNVQNLLKPGGCILISTPNPFYREQYFYVAFKNRLTVNREHTYWIDPLTLDQLARRFGLMTEDVYWIKEKWDLGWVIMNSDSRRFDPKTGKWTFHGAPSLPERLISPVLMFTFKMIAPRRLRSRVLKKHAATQLPRLLYVRAIGVLFSAFWRLYRLLIVSSQINRHEVFLSVLRSESIST
jgi:2-polyprenyl-3-methyl-5-hydroxy-6-metoxy-1,4-benzoquinol methylase